MYKLIKANADSGARYATCGQWGTWMYHVTGDAAYVTKAWAKITTQFLPRQAGELATTAASQRATTARAFHPVRLDVRLAVPRFTCGQRTTLMNKINLMAACANAQPRTPAVSDSDQTTGEYMGMAMWYVATGKLQYCDSGRGEPGRAAELGGLDSTTANYATYRNVHLHVRHHGVSGRGVVRGLRIRPEHTVKLVTLGADAIKTATGVDHFPEITAWQQGAALQYIHTLTPNSGIGGLLEPYLWGDTQSATGLSGVLLLQTALVLAGVTVGTAAGPIIQDWVIDREAASTITSLDPYPRGFLVFDPYATSGSTTPPLQSRSTSPADRCFNSRTGGGFRLVVHGPLPSTAIADHPVNYWGEFQLWKTWGVGITHPQNTAARATTRAVATGCHLRARPYGFMAPSSTAATMPLESDHDREIRLFGQDDGRRLSGPTTAMAAVRHT